ncbi:hypothetical protein TNCV_1325981 [Trichonephila clavipes]|nr:hypothetical protein TNCV_1325981 [Trichonephila clavipes]
MGDFCAPLRDFPGIAYPGRLIVPGKGGGSVSTMITRSYTVDFFPMGDLKERVDRDVVTIQTELLLVLVWTPC